MSKNNRLTFFIFLALILGVILGYVLNINSFDVYNNNIITAESRVESIDTRLSTIKDTASVDYIRLNVEKKEVLKTRKENETIREKKMEPLTLLTDIIFHTILQHSRSPGHNARHTSSFASFPLDGRCLCTFRPSVPAVARFRR